MPLRRMHLGFFCLHQLAQPDVVIEMQAPVYDYRFLPRFQDVLFDYVRRLGVALGKERLEVGRGIDF